MPFNRTRTVFSVFAALLILLAVAGTQASRPPVDTSGSSLTPVIVELFTSEGCSSCPPADGLLKTLSEESPLPGIEIIALEEHVDYWDHLGWKDPYSSSTFTVRQNDYAHKFGNGGVYTPQMIVDGQTEFVGSRSREAREIIQKAAARPKLIIQLTPANQSESGNNAFDIRISNFAKLPNLKEAELWLVITEKNLHTDVKSGENSGERLQHAAIVRSIRKLDNFRSPNDFSTRASLTFDSPWQHNNLALVAFVVDKNSRQIFGAAHFPLTPPQPQH